MGLARRVQGARRRRCRGTSLTTSNAEIARNPHAPYGFRRRGGICGVGAPRRCTPTSPASRRLAYAPAALGTRYLLILGQAPSPDFDRPEGKRRQNIRRKNTSLTFCFRQSRFCLARNLGGRHRQEVSHGVTDKRIICGDLVFINS